MRILIALTALFATALAGCVTDPKRFSPGATSMVEVRARGGRPTDIRFDRNGEELWEYARGPEGTETYLLRFGPDGVLKEVTQLLTDDQLAKVVPGTMTKADVKHLLGRPSEQTFTRAGTVWSWRFKRQGVQPGWLTVVFNPDNTVKDKLAIIDPPGGGRSQEK